MPARSDSDCHLVHYVSCSGSASVGVRVVGYDSGSRWIGCSEIDAKASKQECGLVQNFVDTASRVGTFRISGAPLTRSQTSTTTTPTPLLHYFTRPDAAFLCD